LVCFRHSNVHHTRVFTTQFVSDTQTVISGYDKSSCIDKSSGIEVIKLLENMTSGLKYNESETLEFEDILHFWHFRNSCQTARTYLCAIDCFLELSYRLFLPEMELSYNDHSDFFNLLIICGSTEIEVEDFNIKETYALSLLDERFANQFGPKSSKIVHLFRIETVMQNFLKFFQVRSLVHYLSKRKDFFETSVHLSDSCRLCLLERECFSSELLSKSK